MRINDRIKSWLLAGVKAALIADGLTILAKLKPGVKQDVPPWPLRPTEHTQMSMVSQATFAPPRKTRHAKIEEHLSDLRGLLQLEDDDDSPLIQSFIAFQTACLSQSDGALLEIDDSQTLPWAEGSATVYVGLRPMKVIATEHVAATYRAVDGTKPNVTVRVTKEASDVVLTTAFAGPYNLCPNAMCEANGIPGEHLAPNALGNGVSWAEAKQNSTLVLNYQILPSIFNATQAPEGYSPIPSKIEVKIRTTLFGPRVEA